MRATPRPVASLRLATGCSASRQGLPCLLALSLIACSAWSAPKVASAKTTLRISTWPADASEKLLYDAWAAKYERDHPDIKVKVEVIAGDYLDKLVTAYVAGKAPDVFRIACSWNLPAFASKKMIVPLSQAWLREINFNDLLPSVVRAGTYKGQFYGWDPHLSAYVLHYNKTMLDKAGIPYPDDTWTWDKLAEAAAKLTLKNGTKVTQWGYQADEGDRVWEALTWANGGDLFDPNFTKALYPNDASVAALQYLQRMSLELGAGPKVPSMGSRDAFKQQKQAFLLDGIWMNPSFNANAALKHGTAVMPHAKERATVSVPCLWAINAGAKNKREAWNLLKSWCGVEDSLSFTDNGGPGAYGIPSWKSAVNDPRWRESELLRPLFAEDPYAKPEPSFRQCQKWVGLAQAMVANVVAGRKDPAQAAATLARDTTVLLRQ